MTARIADALVHTDMAIWLAAALCCSSLLLWLGKQIYCGYRNARDYKRRPLMTQRERQAFQELERILPACRIFPQVSMGALIDANARGRRERQSIRNRYQQKVVDFVVEDRRTGDILALIEVDDSFHNAHRDSNRDAITAGAGYRTIRLNHRGRNLAELRSTIARQLPEHVAQTARA